MPVARITLESSNGDRVVVSAPDDEWFDDEIILDTNPDGLYDTGFTVRTVSGAFEHGGRIVGESVPIRYMTLPFHLVPESRKRFQALWGTPGNFRKVKWHYEGRSGRRSLTLRLAKEILYTTEDGVDAEHEGYIHAVVSAVATNPMFEGVEDVQRWVNPRPGTTIDTKAGGGSWAATFTTGTTSHTRDIPYDATPAVLQAGLAGLPNIGGAGNVTVTGNVNGAGGLPGEPVEAHYTITIKVPGLLTTDDAKLKGWGLNYLGAKVFKLGYTPNTGWFEVWNPTDQPLWLEWEFDPANEWQFPDFSFGQERRWNRPAGADADRMIVTPPLTHLLSVMSDPMMDTYMSADLSNVAGLFNGVEPIYPVPPYTAPVMMPVVCQGPSGAAATLRQRRWWSSESGLE